MTIDKVWPSLVAGMTGTVDAGSIQVRIVGGEVQKNIGAGWALFSDLEDYALNTDWELSPISSITSIQNLDLSTLKSAWDSIVYAAAPSVGQAATSSTFKAFAQALGF